MRVCYVALSRHLVAQPRRHGRDRRGVLQTVVWRCLIAQPVVVRRPPHQILVAEPLQILGRDVYPRRFRRGPGWGSGSMAVIISLLEGGDKRAMIRRLFASLPTV